MPKAVVQSEHNTICVPTARENPDHREQSERLDSVGKTVGTSSTNNLELIVEFNLDRAHEGVGKSAMIGKATTTTPYFPQMVVSEFRVGLVMLRTGPTVRRRRTLAKALASWGLNSKHETSSRY